MKNLKINIDSKFIKRLNTLNQDMKYLFNTYYIFPDGYVLSHDKYRELKKGFHYGITPFKLYDIDDVIVLYSDSIFRYIKDNKKDLKHLEFKNNVIYLSGDNDYDIGYLIDKDSLNIKEIVDNKEIAMKNIDDYKDLLELSSTDVNSLVKNKLKDLECEEFKTRITKELMPGLKKSHEVNINFTKDKDVKELFNLILRVKRESIITFHEYKCIFI